MEWLTLLLFEERSRLVGGQMALAADDLLDEDDPYGDADAHHKI